jgi:ankyrin repeat protein
MAAREGHIDYIKYVVSKYEIDIDQIMNDHWTPLFYACLNNHISVIDYLIEKKSNINHLDKFLRTPLHWATKSRAPDAVRILLKHEARYDLFDVEGKKAEDMNLGYDEITELYLNAETERQIKLKKQKRNAKVIQAQNRNKSKKSLNDLVSFI